MINLFCGAMAIVSILLANHTLHTAKTNEQILLSVAEVIAALTFVVLMILA